MDDASGQLGNNGTEIGYLVSGKNGVRFAISKVAELPPRGAVIQPVTQFVLHSRPISDWTVNYLYTPKAVISNIPSAHSAFCSLCTFTISWTFNRKYRYGFSSSIFKIKKPTFQLSIPLLIVLRFLSSEVAASVYSCAVSDPPINLVARLISVMYASFSISIVNE